ncbi:MAG: DUF5056 domain-containing protein [Bacteroidales bacterium]|jgi:hypothetical protein|nr:DUF5056 domain-containing protein [Bacteroidales bacterium]MDD3161646.1 DUF5056 domain-containing protein [Bacteroidales bacterium]
MVHDSDDQLIRNYLKQTEKKLSDEGFSARVMRHLPGRAECFVQVWTLLCVVSGVFLFVSIDGCQLVANLMQKMGLALLDSGILQQNPLHLSLITTLIAGYIGYKVYSNVVQ